MKKGIKIATAVALGLATAAWAGQGMGQGNGGGQGNCGQGQGMQKGQGQMMGQNMQRGHHGQKGQRGHRAPMMKRMMSQLDLTDAQKTEIQQIMREGRQHMKGQKGMAGQGMKGQGKMQGQGKGMHRGQRGRLGLDASQFMSKESFDKEAFKKAMQAKWQKQDELRQQRRAARLDRMADRMEKIFKVLTPEQREKLIELSKQK